MLMTDDKEYKFTTYNNSKITQYEVKDNHINITLKKDEFNLSINAKLENGQKLSAPEKGKMDKEIFESINSVINVTLKNGNNIIFKDTSTNCGLEIVI